MIHILTTGGSIDKMYSTTASNFIVGEPYIAQVLEEANVNLAYTVTSLMHKDSLELTDDDRALITAAARHSPHRQIIITHGTDTMVKTASVLRDISNKTIVITGAMQPASFKVTDAALNIGVALAAVQTMPPGVYIAMSGLIIPAERARKNYTTGRYDQVDA